VGAKNLQKINKKAFRSRLTTNSWNSVQLYRRVGLTVSSCASIVCTLGKLHKKGQIYRTMHSEKSPHNAERQPMVISWRR